VNAYVLAFGSLLLFGGRIGDMFGRRRVFRAELVVFAFASRVWPGRLVVKGILDVRAARRCVETGADGIIVSNHGGRQLDGPVSPLRVDYAASVAGEAGVRDMAMLGASPTAVIPADSLLPAVESIAG